MEWHLDKNNIFLEKHLNFDCKQIGKRCYDHPGKYLWTVSIYLWLLFVWLSDQTTYLWVWARCNMWHHMVHHFSELSYWYCHISTQFQDAFGPNPIFLSYSSVTKLLIFVLYFFVFLLPIFARISVSHLPTLASMEHIMSHISLPAYLLGGINEDISQQELNPGQNAFIIGRPWTECLKLLLPISSKQVLNFICKIDVIWDLRIGGGQLNWMHGQDTFVFIYFLVPLYLLIHSWRVV